MNSGSGHEVSVSACKRVSGHADVCGCGYDYAGPMSERCTKMTIFTIATAKTLQLLFTV